ncbi:hypothetical protein [Saccharopolyspora phatthalungensis]|uniref:Uncharacterized protein n=1 Tax=Saccharopolyspora phatthalungensis TaxID=664693 RepID=A0A840QBD9_9PSEU|nr:hypothetical protein [Saccharopolyspora phatthalungensis]MBB5157120.1 hypothetical protein [Saccharopolyspora phatthalungensis]
MDLSETNPFDFTGNSRKKVIPHFGKRVQRPTSSVEQHRVAVDTPRHTPQKATQPIRLCRLTLHQAKLINALPQGRHRVIVWSHGTSGPVCRISRGQDTKLVSVNDGSEPEPQ